MTSVRAFIRETRSTSRPSMLNACSSPFGVSFRAIPRACTCGTAVMTAVAHALVAIASIAFAAVPLAQDPPPNVSGDLPSPVEIRASDEKTGQPIPYVSVHVLDSGESSTGTQAGTLTLELPLGTHRVRLSHVSYEI